MTNVDSQRIKEIRDNTRAMAEAFGRIADTLAEALELYVSTQTETQNSNLTFEKRTIDYCDVCNHKGCDNCIADGNNPYCVPSHYEPKDEPQTDGYMTEEQTEDYRKMLDKAEHKVYGNIEDEQQTERSDQ